MILSLILLVTFKGYSSGPEIPNQKEFEEISLMTAMASADGDADMAQIISERALNKQDMCGDPDKKVAGPFLKDVKFITPPAIEIKKSPKVTFYSRFIAPVEEMKFYDVTKSGDNLPDLEKVVKAQGDKERNSEIKKLCEGKSSLEKIKYASTLFEKLNDVYNHGMIDGNDPYTAEDVTKKPNEYDKISIQRQYNTLNGQFFGSNENYPPKAGVCRHAAILVSDFLDKCGMKAESLGYSTNSPHAVVKAIDPKSKKTYFLNWGELKVGDRPEALSQFDIPSTDMKGMGMIISHFHQDDGKVQTGNTRTNSGVVVARLLNVSDNNFDFTTYGTNELGATIELRNSTIKNPKNGVIRTVHDELTINSITADRNKTDFYSLTATNLGKKDEVLVKKYMKPEDFTVKDIKHFNQGGMTGGGTYGGTNGGGLTDGGLTGGGLTGGGLTGGGFNGGGFNGGGFNGGGFNGGGFNGGGTYGGTNGGGLTGGGYNGGTNGGGLTFEPVKLIREDKNSTIEGTSFSLKSETSRISPNKNYDTTILQGTIGIFNHQTNITKSSDVDTIWDSEKQSGIAGAFIVDKKIGTTLKKGDNLTQVEAGVKGVSEIYLIKTKIDQKTYNGFEMNTYLVPSVRVKTDSPRNYVELDASATVTRGDRLSQNSDTKATYAVSQPKINLVFAEKIANKQTVGVNASYVGSFDRESTTLEAFYENHKHKTSASGGFVVVKSDDGRSDVYAILKTGKDVKWGSGDIKTNIEARKAVTNSNPAAIQATVSIKK